MENLLSLIEIARLDYGFIATEENAEFESKNGERGAKRASDSSSRPFTTSHGAEVLIRSDRDDHPIRPRANDARYHFGNQVFGEERGNVVFSSTNNGGLVSGLRLVKRHGPPDLSAVSEPHPGAEAEVVGTSQSPRTARLGGAGPASVREAMSHEIAHNIHKAEQGPDLQPQKTSKLGQRRRMYGAQEDSQREELLRNVRRSQIRHGQMQRRYEEGRSPRRRMIPEHDEKKKIVSATGPCLPINPVKGIRGRVRRNRTGRSSLEAGNNLQTWRTEKELGPQQQARTSWKMRQEALAALEGRIQTSAQMNDAKETRVGDQPDDFLRVPSSPGLMMVLAHTRRRITSSGTGL
ncbi:hypothetical protein LY78DRAFT_650413 [Colletotrichum sublineola]|nr:hypothetical protein LY78DRAFT_650413 [Colletotrichum sublineola]